MDLILQGFLKKQVLGEMPKFKLEQNLDTRSVGGSVGVVVVVVGVVVVGVVAVGVVVVVGVGAFPVCARKLLSCENRGKNENGSSLK